MPAVTDAAAPAAKKARKDKTVEEIYQKKTQLEHILLRPDTYIGSVEERTDNLWVFNEDTAKMEYRPVSYVPGLYKIFDEILVNAADNMARDPKGMDQIRVDIDKVAGTVAITNNGEGVPVTMHKVHKMYVPELIFGNLLTGDNYDDSEKKVTGGRNGYGAKLTNIFSKSFTIETADTRSGQKFVCTWTDNMSKKGKPVISKNKGSSYTKVIFKPDLAKFGMLSLDRDIVGLMMKRSFDMAGTTPKRCKVYLNGKKLGINSFKDYMSLYTPEENTIIHEVVNDRWEIGFTVSESQFNQVSFVNSIATTRGGEHVKHVADQLIDRITTKVKGKNRGGMDIKPAHVKNHVWIFVNALIENPSFDSQTKETLTLKPTKFGSKCDVPDGFVNKVLKSGVVDLVLNWARAKQNVDLARKMKKPAGGGRVLGIPKLEDANKAGTRDGEKCTLILTEGDSAKALAVAGLGVVGRDHYGVFPLKGKVLNVRDASFNVTVKNAEIQNLMKIVGLDIKRKYEEGTKSLRYGHIMIMTDQDHDGSHIKGLLINLIHHWWPALLTKNGFLVEFVTPIVKATKGNQEVQFFTLNEYKEWRRKHNDGKGWTIKYYKGLGTSTAKEAKEYFRGINDHQIDFEWLNDNDGEAIDMAFNKKRADDRKNWIASYDENDFVDHSQSRLNYSDFIHKELVQFSRADVLRSIPSLVDGFKPTQRKVMFCSFKRNLKNDVKVAQFVGYISEHSAYHHGEASLESTIVSMAQDFVGSNNVNLLFPSGQFGTRLAGGKDHAASRYIYTRMSKTTRCIFPIADDPILTYLSDEGQSIEPRWYTPILPMILVNGADGIGTGWSTSIPCYNPRDLIFNIKRYLRGLSMEHIHPWFRGFKGTVTEVAPGKYEIVGTVERKSDNTVEITELPIRYWTTNQKEYYQEMLQGNEKKKDGEEEDADSPKKKDKKGKNGKKGDKKEKKAAGPGFRRAPDQIIEDIAEYHTETLVHFKLTVPQAKLDKAEREGLDKVFRLRGSVSTSNMILFDASGKIARYDSALDILRSFCDVRIQYYQKRKDYMMDKLGREKEILNAKVKFILMVIDGKLKINNRKRADLLEDLKKKGFKPMSEIQKGALGRQAQENENEEEGDKKKKSERSEYDYLLGMPMWNLTLEKVEELKKQLKDKTTELENLKVTMIEAMWDKDLDELLKALDEQDRLDEAEQKAANALAHKTASKTEGRGKKGAKPKAKGKRKRKNDSSSEDEWSDDSDDVKRKTTKVIRRTEALTLNDKEELPAWRAGFKIKQSKESLMAVTVHEGLFDRHARSALPSAEGAAPVTAKLGKQATADLFSGKISTTDAAIGRKTSKMADPFAGASSSLAGLSSNPMGLMARIQEKRRIQEAALAAASTGVSAASATADSLFAPKSSSGPTPMEIDDPFASKKGKKAAKKPAKKDSFVVSDDDEDDESDVAPKRGKKKNVIDSDSDEDMDDDDDDSESDAPVRKPVRQKAPVKYKDSDESDDEDDDDDDDDDEDDDDSDSD